MGGGLAIAVVVVVVLPAVFLATGALVCAVLGESFSGRSDDARPGSPPGALRGSSGTGRSGSPPTAPSG